MEQVSWEKEIPHKKAAFTFSEGIKSDIKLRSSGATGHSELRVVQSESHE